MTYLACGEQCPRQTRRQSYIAMFFLILSLSSEASSSYTGGSSAHQKLSGSLDPISQMTLIPRRRFEHDHTQLLWTLRGGATASKAISLDDAKEGDSSFVVSKLRNIIRSLLDVGERKSPTLTRVARALIRTCESMSGIRLLPVEQPKTKKKKASQAKSRKRKAPDRAEKEEIPLKASTKLKSTMSLSSSKPTKATSKHLGTPLTSKHANYRIQKELKEFIKSPPANLAVKVGSNIRIWIITLSGAEGTIYEGESYKLRVQFPASYPMVPPSVYFLAPPPQHEHVYTNGDICLSLLGDGWRPTMTAQSIAVSILSILSSAQTKSLPMDNARHSQAKPGQYQKDWVYHDDNC